jgi:hypothetical protein
MKRRTLVIDENLLRQAMEVLGTDSSSAAVCIVLLEVLRSRKALRLSSFFGLGLWGGNLSEMRGDLKRRKNSS